MSAENTNPQQEHADKVQDVLNKLGDIFKEGKIDTEKLKKQVRLEDKKINIMVIGKTGVGKSTLINTVFGLEDENAAPIGEGTPITQTIQKYEHPEKSVVLWDTKGIEAKDYAATIQAIKDDIHAEHRIQNADQSIHLAWVCIAETGDRIEEGDKEIVNFLDDVGIPTIIILTKLRPLTEKVLFEKCKTELSRAKAHLRVNAKAYEYETEDGSMKMKISGIDELLAESNRLVPLAYSNALRKSQIWNLRYRKDAMLEEAKNKVHLYSAMAATAGASPIPMSDAPLIAAVQSKMIYDLNQTFQVEANSSAATSLIAGILGTTALANIGKTIVATALKFTGIGTVVGGAISGGTAFALTEALGHAYIAVLEKLLESSEDGIIRIEYAETILEMLQAMLQNKK